MIRNSDNTATTQMRGAKDGGTDDDDDDRRDDGILFGGNCERLIFFPGSNKRNEAVAVNVHGSHQRTAAVTDPLSALGLFPPSPYDVLRQNAPVAAYSAQEESVNGARVSKSPNHQHLHSQRPSSREEIKTVEKKGFSSIEEPWTTAAATSGNGGRHTSPHHGSSQEPTFEEIYSPQRPRRCRGRRQRHADVTRKSSNCSASEESLREDESAVLLLQKIRADEKATLYEAARLRNQADASAMIRRFWRRSG